MYGIVAIDGKTFGIAARIATTGPRTEATAARTCGIAPRIAGIGVRTSAIGAKIAAIGGASAARTRERGGSALPVTRSAFAAAISGSAGA